MDEAEALAIWKQRQEEASPMKVASDLTPCAAGLLCLAADFMTSTGELVETPHLFEHTDGSKCLLGKCKGAENA